MFFPGRESPAGTPLFYFDVNLNNYAASEAEVLKKTSGNKPVAFIPRGKSLRVPFTSQSSSPAQFRAVEKATGNALLLNQVPMFKVKGSLDRDNVPVTNITITKPRK